MDPAVDPALERELLLQQGFLRALARGLVGDARAEDVVQEAFVAALERPPRERAALRGWLARVVRTRALNAGREERRRERRQREAAREEALPSHAEMLEQLELQRALTDCVEALPEPYRGAIFLRYHEGLSSGEIARRLGVQVATVKTRHRRALVLLRERLDQRCDRRAWTGGVVALARPRPGGAALLGGMLTMKKWIALAVALAVAAGGWWFRGALMTARPAAAVARAEVEVDVPAPAPPVERAPAAAEERAPLAAPPTAAGAATLLVDARWADGSPAAGVGLFVQGADELAVERPVTDAEGRARVAGLPPGEVRVETWRGGAAAARLESGRETRVAFEIPLGVDVEGRVLDPDGRRVAGAEVWIERDARGWPGGELATTSGADGSFRLRSVARERMLAARAPGYAAALGESLRSKRAAPGRPLELELRLRPRGGALRGVVLDELGQPLAGAWIAVHPLEPHGLRANGSFGAAPAAELARADEAGRFRFDAVDAGELRVEAAAPGLAPAVVRVEVEPDAERELELRLVAAATLSGRALGPRGEPLQGVELGVSVAGGEPSGESALPRPGARSGADGGYVLGPLPPGLVVVHASAPDALELPVLSRELVLAAGETARWDPRLEEHPRLRGRVVDEEGDGLSHWTVSAYAGGELPQALATTDADGGFVLLCDGPGPYRVEAAAPSTLRGRAAVDGAFPDAPPIELVVPSEREASCFVRGRFHDAAGLARGERVFAAPSPELGTLLDGVEVVDGAFRLGPLPPGSYRVAVVAGGRTLTIGERFELAPGEELDLGTLETRAPGSVRLEAQLGEGVEPRALQLMLVDYSTGYAHGLAYDGASGFDGSDVPAGRYGLLLLSQDVALRARALEVHAGEEARAEIELARGVQQLVTLVLPEGDWSTLTLSAKRADGALQHESSFPASTLREALAPATFPLVLPAGRFVIEASLDDGRSARAEVAVDSLDTPLAPLELAP